MAEGLTLPTTDGRRKYVHTLEVPSLHGTPFISSVPLDRHGGVLAPSLQTLHGKPTRTLGEFATVEEAALASSRYVSAYALDHESLVSGLLGDASGGHSRSTLTGTPLDFYWPMDDVWYDATCVEHVGDTRYADGPARPVGPHSMGPSHRMCPHLKRPR